MTEHKLMILSGKGILKQLDKSFPSLYYILLFSSIYSWYCKSLDSELKENINISILLMLCLIWAYSYLVLLINSFSKNHELCQLFLQ